MSPYDVRRVVRELIGPYTAKPEVSSATIDDLLFFAMSDMLRRAKPGFLRTESAQNIVAGTVQYKVPVGLAPLSLRVIGNDGEYSSATKTTKERLDEMGSHETDEADARVLYYYEAGIYTTNDADYGKRLIRVWPEPDTSITNGLVYRYLRLPTRVSAMASETQELVDVTSDFHIALCYWIAWSLGTRQTQKASKQWDFYRQIYDDAVAQFVVLHGEQNMDDLEPFTGIRDFVGGWE